MDSQDDQHRMFRLELQVGDITWAPDTVAELSGTEGTICVSFQLLSYPPLEICQDKFCAQCAHDDLAFKSGKMMIFALQRSDLVRLHNNFLMHVRVVNMTLKAGRLPYRTELATAEVNISNDFSAILSTCFQPQTQHPAYKFINDEIDLLDSSGVTIGVMNMFLRLSTYGPTLMGHLYSTPGSNTGVLKVEPDLAAQALVTQSQVSACPRRYVNRKSVPAEATTCREYRLSSEENNMLAVRFYKLEMETQPPARHSKHRGSQPVEPGTLVLTGAEVEYVPDPEFTKSDNASSVYYRAVSNASEGPSDKQILQFIPTPSGEPGTGLGPVTGLPPDNKVDVYVLRVGKKRAGYALKTHLEVELRTPKFLSRKKERFYKDTQYESKDLVPAEPPI